MIQQRKKPNPSKTSLIISVVFHTTLILAVFFFAAREGILGKKLKQLTVTMVPKEKKPEPPKEKPLEPKPDVPKPAEAPKMAAAAPKVTEAPPPVVATAPIAAPSAASLPAFEFNDGAKEVKTLSNPNDIYKALVEHALLSRWNRPENIADETFIAEVELSVDSSGKVREYRWLNGSGNARWDNSVKAALALTKAISRPPPKGFPDKFLVRFDVESLRTESIQVSIQ
jgi:outer membrane biosynthesis protein TonB